MEETSNKTVTKENKKTKTRTWIVIAFIVVIAMYLFVSIRGGYLNALELGSNYIDVFETNLKYNFITMAVNFVIIFASIYITNKIIKKGLKKFFEEDKLDVPKLPNKSIALILGAIISIVISPMFLDKIMLAFNATWFGISDPIFNFDIGYFFFQKPFIELVLYYLLGLMIMLTVYTSVYYIVAFNKYFDGINLETLKKNTFIKQLYTNVIIIAIIIAGIILISTQNIIYQKFINGEIGSESAIYGAGITDVTIKLWGYRILSVLIIIAVAVAIRFISKSQKRKAVISLCTIPAYLVALFIVITGFQLIFVNPNELDKEKNYISYNIENTKKAYKINITEREIKSTGAITQEEANINQGVISNVPIITKDITLKTLEEYQTSTGYYTYRNTNLAKYSINGKNELMYLSPREMKIDNKTTYDNKTYEYTHGYGVILSDATKTDENGNIEYIQKSFEGEDDKLNITQPRIYFGTQTNNNIIVNVKNNKEFDYPLTSSTNTENIYNGRAGLSLNFIDRLVLGISNGDLGIVFNTNLKDNSKIITNRNITQRVKALMPYLTYDPNPYMVVREDGSLVWVLDAYTTSNSYPYSQESTIVKDGLKTRINYIRNSVKVIIDAYNGTMSFYLIDRSDPIAMAYRNIYPNLFMPLEGEIPTDIAEHIVYPKYLYDIQAKMLTRYHNIQTEVLYRNDDIWSIAKTSSGKTMTQNIGTEMDAYYTMVKTTDEDKEELGLVIPYTLAKKQNINAYLVGKYNNENQLTLYKFKADDNVLGAMQLENQIERDEIISKELESINTTGVKTVKTMIIVPVNNTLLYVEPIYQVLLNETKIPVLKKVIVASGNRVAIGDNLEEAMKNLLSQQAVELEVQNTDTQADLIQSIIKANNNLSESSNNNNWELMGKDINKLQELIKELEKLVEEEKITNNTVDVNTIEADLLSNTIISNQINE